MRFLLTLSVTLISASLLLAINPVKGKIETSKIEAIEKGAVNIDLELDQLLQASTLIKANNLSYGEFKTNNAVIATELNIASEVETGILEGSPNAPVGIPGFWWGFCFGLIGLIVVYVAMEDGEERKEQAKNAVYGCLASVVFTGLLYAVGILSF